MSDTTSASPAVTFAGVMLVVAGIWQAFLGLVALFNDTFYVVGEKWIVQFDVTTWGWIHLIIGVLVLIAGLGVFAGSGWARWLGIVIAGVSMIATFFWLPWYPLWGILLITVDVVIVWALAEKYRSGATA